jgi:hypothetical protein
MVVQVYQRRLLIAIEMNAGIQSVMIKVRTIPSIGSAQLRRKPKIHF